MYKLIIAFTYRISRVVCSEMNFAAIAGEFFVLQPALRLRINDSRSDDWMAIRYSECRRPRVPAQRERTSIPLFVRAETKKKNEIKRSSRREARESPIDGSRLFTNEDRRPPWRPLRRPRAPIRSRVSSSVSVVAAATAAAAAADHSTVASRRSIRLRFGVDATDGNLRSDSVARATPRLPLPRLLAPFLSYSRI